MYTLLPCYNHFSQLANVHCIGFLLPLLVFQLWDPLYLHYRVSDFQHGLGEP